MLRLLIVVISLFSMVSFAQPQPSYWQQQANYTMEIDINTKKHLYKGTQKIEYINNSPDTLKQLFFYLYFNAFQPGSEMDVRSLNIKDADSRVGDRISKLKPNEIGFLTVQNLKVNNQKVSSKLSGTVLEVTLNEPILPKSTTEITLEFNGQVPIQIRRSGRNNKEGIALSMTQWYPKLAEYDDEGWHADPYIGREFHGVFGNYDVKLNLNSQYTVAGTGILQNPEKIGHGYVKEEILHKKNKNIEWHFIAKNVHDFAWAADTNYKHDILNFDSTKKLHFFYKNEKKYEENWSKLQPIALKLMNFYQEHIGEYLYPQYSIIQGGDGGMEYAMCTLITGDRKFESLVGVTAHEMAHAWFQHILATNESKYEWMDEGFTTYISTIAENVVLKKNKEFPLQRSYDSYKQLATSGIEQPQTTHSDRYAYNYAYGISAYSKGSVFLDQLGYIIGEKNIEKTLKSYYKHWKLKHPKPNDFKRIAEKTSGIQLDWYLTDWTKTTNTIDYGIQSVKENKDHTSVITLERKGLMPMPIDLSIEFTDGTSKNYYIPLTIMRGKKRVSEDTKVLNSWAWAYPTYSFNIEIKKEKIKAIILNPSQKMADINPLNNTFKP